MKISVNQYKESLLQWIWQELMFNCADLNTECGKRLEVISLGRFNKGAGPDFLNGSFIVEGVKWHGSVEIHKFSKDWFTHGHHEDSNYNTVVLHVVYDEGGAVRARTEDGHIPFTLNLRKYVARPLYRLLKLKQLPDLACSASGEFINQMAFERQIEKVHQEYFEYKVEEVLSFYPVRYGLEKAWKSAFISQCYLTLGVSANTRQMKELSEKLLLYEEVPEEKTDFIMWIYKTAFNSGAEDKNEIDWVTSGLRPAGQPVKRVKQAAVIHFFIENISLIEFMEGPGYFFDQLTDQTDKSELPGKMLRDLLFYLSVVPSFYLLGELVHSKKLKGESHKAWMDGQQPVPQSIKKKYESAGFIINKELQKLGVAHQYKRYCSWGGCKSCEVFKSSIQA